MSFVAPALLWGLALCAVPVLLHLFRKRSTQTISWGAMQFLQKSLISRRRRIELEDALLLLLRCLLAACVALAFARPFAPTESAHSMGVLIPVGLVMVSSLALAVALRERRRWLWGLLGVAALCLVVVVLLLGRQLRWNAARFGQGGGRDIALVLDVSHSMSLGVGSQANMELATQEASEIVRQAAVGTAFSLIAGSAEPQAPLPTPLQNRRQVLEALTQLSPKRGRMAALEALAQAVISLSQGQHTRKDIIVFTDGQTSGWESDRSARWEALRESMALLPTQPRLIIRRLPLPAVLRNVALTGVTFSREIVGRGQPVGVEVTMENTGTEAISPARIALEVDGMTQQMPGPGQLLPGGKGTVRFTCQLEHEGHQVVTARILTEDALPGDDTLAAVCLVRERIKVLIVEGSAATRFMERQSACLTLALLPAAMSREAATPEKPKLPELLDLQVIPAGRLVDYPQLTDHTLIILSDVARLPDAAAARVATWVSRGGSLLVLPGIHAEPSFYNEWRLAERALLPASIGEEVLPATPLYPAMESLKHPAFAVLRAGSDLASATLQRYRPLEVDLAVGAEVFAACTNGAPLLVSRRQGSGVVALAAINFTPEAGGLVSRQSFVPFVHQFINYLVQPDGLGLRTAPGMSARFFCGPAGSSGGLLGRYFRTGDELYPLLTRVDPAPDFQWSNNSPGTGVPPDFSAQWSGTLIPRYSEEYLFDGWGDDRLDVKIAGKTVISRGGEGRIPLQAGHPTAIEIDFADHSGGAALQLFWRSASQERELVPQSCLQPSAPHGEGGSIPMGAAVVRTPEDTTLAATVSLTPQGKVAAVEGCLLPGLHRIQMTDGKVIPFTVDDDVEESRAAASAHGRQSLPAWCSHLQPSTAEELLGVMKGKGFGEELWRTLAWCGLGLLLLESCWLRWVHRGQSHPPPA